MRLELSSLRAQGASGASNSLFAQWRVGAIIEAVAVRDIADGKLWLNIGNTRVPARIASGDATGPANGERLQLRVLRDHPVLALESLVTEDNDTNAVNDGLRRFLPRQASPAALLANLALLANSSKEGDALPRSIRLAADRLWQALPQTTELTTPAGLAASVQRSGAFLEAALAKADPADTRGILTRDIKALLVDLKQALQRGGATIQLNNSPTADPLPIARGTLQALSNAAATLSPSDTPATRLNELATQTDGALARLNTVQLVNAEQATSAPTWLVEVPMKRDGQPEALRFRFERHSSPQPEGEQSWTVEAALNLRESGALHARVSLYGSRVSIQLRAESPALVAELSARAPELRAMLSDAGLEVDRVACVHGLPLDAHDLRSNAPLLDVHV